MGIRKTYITVSAIFNVSGLLPLSIVWYDGTCYPIERVTEVRKAASLKAGGSGIRYTCIINGKERYLWREKDRWFVEETVPDEMC